MEEKKKKCFLKCGVPTEKIVKEPTEDKADCTEKKKLSSYYLI